MHLDYLNVQGQPKLTWPATFAVARAYVDQLERSNGLTADKVAATRAALARAERLKGAERRDALTQLATQLGSYASPVNETVVVAGGVRFNAPGGATDQAKIRTLAATVTDLANADR